MQRKTIHGLRWFGAVALATGLVSGLAAVQHMEQEPAESIRTHFQAAQKAQREGDLLRAESDYREALGVSLEELGLIEDTRGDLDKAADAYQGAIHAKVDSDSALLGLAVVYLRQGKFQEGVDTVKRLLAQKPFHPEARDLLGKLYFSMNRFDLAVQELGEAHRLAPDDPSVSFALGLAHLKQKNLESARKIFAAMLRQQGDAPRVHIAFGAAYRETEYVNQAVEEFQRAIALDQRYPHVHYYLGLAYLDQGGSHKIPEAIKEIEIELRRDSNDYLSNYLIGLIYFTDRQFDKAIPYLEKAARLDPQKPDAYVYLGRALYLSGDRGKAVPILQKAIALTKDPSRNNYQISNVEYVLGEALSIQGDGDEAKGHLLLAQQYKAKSAVEDRERLGRFLHSGDSGPEDLKSSMSSFEGKSVILAPPTPSAAEKQQLDKAARYYAGVAASAAKQLGLIRASQSDFKRAADYFAEASSWDSQMPDIDFNLGLAQFKAQNYGEAIAPLEKARIRQPKRKDVQTLLGMSYFFSEDYIRANEQLGPLVEGGLDDPQALYAMGLSLAHSGEQERGEQLLRNLVQRYPKVADAHLALGQALALSGRYEAAKAEFAKALELDPAVPEAHYYLGLAFLRQSNFSEAAKEFRQEITQDPQEARAEYHLGLCLLSMDRTDDAIHSFNEAVRLNPSYADAYYEMGKARLGQGQTQEAVSLLEKAVQLEGDRSYSQYQLSQAYLKAGKPDAAQAALVRYRELKAREHKMPRGQGDASEQ